MQTKQISRDAVMRDGCEFEAVIATLGVADADGDVIAPGAFAGAGSVPVLWGHDSAAVPIGKATIRERGNLVIAHGSLIDDGACAWLRADVATPPAVQEWSWGFLPIRWRFGDLEGRKVRFLEEVDLIEVSGVIRGASVGTRTLSAKAQSCGCGGACGSCSPRLTELELYAHAAHEFARRVSGSKSPTCGPVCVCATCCVNRTLPARSRGILEWPDSKLREAGFARYHVAWDRDLSDLAKEIADDGTVRAFSARLAKAGRVVLSNSMGWAFTDAGYVGVDVEHVEGKQFTMFVLAHEVAHLAGAEDEEACNRFARRVTEEAGWPEHAEAFYAVSQGENPFADAVS
ncbi:MAG: HK97 family phage prohead protease [Thermoanaerobaculia bacterium]